MRQLVVTLFLLFTAAGLQAQDTMASQDSMVFMMVEQTPQFPGGEAAMVKFIATNIAYPHEAVENNIQGKVFVEFIVEADGSISNVKTIKSVHPLLDAEAVRVIKIMPRWNPGRQQGTPVRVKFTLPVIFKLK